MAANTRVNGNIVYEQSAVIKKAIRALKNLSSDEELRKVEINSVLDTLNALEYSVNFIEEKDSDELLQICMDILSTANEHLLSKWCHLVTNLITRQQVIMQRNNVKILMDYVVSKISVSGTWSLPDLLSVLSVLLQSGGSEMEMFWERLLGDNGILLKFSMSNYPDRDVHHITLKCLENLLARKQNEAYPHEKILLNCFSVLLTCLKAGTSVATDNTSNCKLIVTTMKALQNLLLGWKTIPIGQLGILLSVIKFYLFHGQPGQGSFSPVCLYPSVNSQLGSQRITNQPSFPKLVPQKRRNRRKAKGGRKGNAGKKDKEEEDSLSEGNSSDTGYSSQQRYINMQPCPDWKPNLTPPWLTSSSDSEYSDSEGNQMLKLRAVQSLVRQHAFSTLQAVIRITDKKSMFGYWLSFLPDSPSNTISQSQTILVTILKDPSPQVRAAAISVLTDLLTGSKQFLMMADESVAVRTAFIPLSATLGSLVRELHRCLLLCLIAENTSFILIQLLKCYAVLVNNIPYHRFHPDLLIRLIKHLRPLLCHKDSQVQVACLSVMGSIVCVQPVPKEVAAILEDLNNNKLDELDQAMSGLSCERIQIDKEESMSESKFLESGKEVPWLVKLCHENILADDKVPLPVQLESLQVLALFAKAYFNVVRKHLCIFENLIMNCLQHRNSFLQLHGTKLLEATGSSINNDIKTVCHSSEDVSTKDSCLSLDKATEFWQKLLMGSLPQCLQNENHPTLRAICCNCLSTLTSEILDNLPKTLKILCLTLMLGLGSDRDPNVKGAAIRCLGIYVLFPCLGEDSSFIMNAGDVIMEAVKDEHFGVRAKASWSLGNLSNALLSNKDDWPDFSLDVPDVFLYSVGEAAIYASKDHDNVRANAVRTLGNLLHYLPENLLYKDRMKIMIAESISALLLNLKTRFVKVRWNSCYALGKVLQNLSLLKSSLLPMDQIILSLLATLKEGSNFKVCINAATSLSSVTQRELYGLHFFDIWNQIIFSLSNTYSDVDFKELRHKDNFCNQLCISLCHLTSLLQIDDLSCIYEITLCSMDSLISSMKKLSHIDNPDEKLEKAAIHINELMQSPELNNEQKMLLNSLKEVISSALQ